MASFFDDYGHEREDVFFEQALVQSFNNDVEKTNFHTYGLTGDWGSGKTTFIKMWEDYVKEQRKANYSIIHVDAFLKDYLEDPFSMLFGAIKNYMRENDVSSDSAKKLVETAKKIGTAATKALAYSLVQLIPGGFGKDFLDKFVDELDYSNTEEEDICVELHTELQKIINKVGKKLYIVVDELDRCRPDFALECLERIKHLFSVEGIKFIIVYNPKIISNIVKTKYGCLDDDARQYIHKFVEDEINFSLSLQASLRRFIEYESSLLEQEDSSNSSIINNINWSSGSIAQILLNYRITSLREIRFLIISICNWLKDVPHSDSSGIWYVLPILRTIDYEEYTGIVDYLSKNQSLDINAPKRTTCYNIAKYLMSNKSTTEIDDQLESVYKSFRDYFY